MDNPNWLNDLFISQAKPALSRHEGSSDDSGSDVIISSLVDDINGESDIAGSLTEKLEYLGGTKSQLKEVAIDNGVAVDDDTPFRDYPEAFNEKMSDFNKFVRAVWGGSADDWNYWLDEDGNKNITVETRGITYTAAEVTSPSAAYNGQEWGIIHIFPETDLYYDLYKNSAGKRSKYCFIPCRICDHNAFGADVFDFSRLPDDEYITFRVPLFPGEGIAMGFLAFPPSVDFAKSVVSYCHNQNQSFFSKGLSFGKSVSNMTNAWLYYDHSANSEKPVYVMEGFIGNLYLSKLNISAEHLIGIINNLGEGSYNLNIGSHNTAKLTEEQIAIATAKGWTVS